LGEGLNFGKDQRIEARRSAESEREESIRLNPVFYSYVSTRDSSKCPKKTSDENMRGGKNISGLHVGSLVFIWNPLMTDSFSPQDYVQCQSSALM